MLYLNNDRLNSGMLHNICYIEQQYILYRTTMYVTQNNNIYCTE